MMRWSDLRGDTEGPSRLPTARTAQLAVCGGRNVKNGPKVAKFLVG